MKAPTDLYELTISSMGPTGESDLEGGGVE
jgi:hypothetical protein